MTAKTILGSAAAVLLVGGLWIARQPRAITDQTKQTELAGLADQYRASALATPFVTATPQSGLPAVAFKSGSGDKKNPYLWLLFRDLAADRGIYALPAAANFHPTCGEVQAFLQKNTVNLKIAGYLEQNCRQPAASTDPRFGKHS